MNTKILHSKGEVDSEVEIDMIVDSHLEVVKHRLFALATVPVGRFKYQLKALITDNLNETQQSTTLIVSPELYYISLH